HTKLVGGATLEFKGVTHNLSSIGAFLSEQDRELRHQALQTKAARYEANDKAHNDLYDRMVQTRHKQARKM
ncbi:M3 family oligoendopeptidase, partial [Patescibacteria group bacterium]|nr:M3 family oligoendopeptidase [Patescibacteria group bacterium]